MLYSKSFIFTLREDPKVAECVSHRLLLKGSFLYMISSGIYSYLPLGYRVLENISNIIRKHMNSNGAQELLMSALQPIEMWQKTGRDQVLSEVMFKFKDRKNRTLVLGPTHEEEVTEIVKKHISSYKQLPCILYQIQTKFRDETRPRFGIVRSCEFIMKDAYSFDVDEAGLAVNYDRMLSAYQAIFKECGLNFIMTEADPGAMGGNVSHEFMVPAEIGEDVLCHCEKCDRHFKDMSNCPDCEAKLKERRMIEIGHIFKLGTKYSSAQEALFLDNTGTRKPVIMGCYGIGVSRLLSAIVETNYDEKGIMWPKAISPFDAEIVCLDEKLLAQAATLSETLEASGFKVLLDERSEPAGVKFNDAYLLGNPHIVIIGKNYANSKKIDLEIRKTRQKLSMSEEELVNFLNNEYGK
ncbi:MAG: proline--tRNA ligase [Candidatus Omnitrophica bacterium]|jgi:prolyl-tRNA synthetase|nr:proline--tRNA ligase [Candidatus Omnitrophota bacterium]